MLKYLLKRILFFVPTIWIISLLTFSLSVNSPGDPVDIMLNTAGESGQNADKQAKQKEYDAMREKLHLNLPVFYFDISSLAEPDTLYKIPKKLHRENLDRLVSMYGNWPLVSAYYHQIEGTEKKVDQISAPDSLKDELIKARLLISELYYKYDEVVLREKHKKISEALHKINPSFDYDHSLLVSYDDMVLHLATWKNYLPSFHWNGYQNQYHIWLTNLFKGDFGTSYYHKRSVLDLISERIMPTIVYSFLSIIIAFLVSIPLGVSAAVTRGTKKEKVITILLFILYSLPSFWIGTLLINYFTNPIFFDWFPSTGLKDFDDQAGFFERLSNYVDHMVLPLFCYTYSSFAFISRQMRGSMIQTLNQDYIRTAWAKGLSERKIYWKHVLRNSLLPLITLMSSVFPSLIAGSVVIEYLFTLPGMGLLAYESEVSKDYPVIYIIMLFSAALTLIGYLVADILYAIVDPRISYGKK